MNSNQPAYVKVNFPKQAFNLIYFLSLLDLLEKAGTLEKHELEASIVLRPPKGVVNNQHWAERVCGWCTSQGLPSLIIRPDNVSVAIR